MSLFFCTSKSSQISNGFGSKHNSSTREEEQSLLITDTSELPAISFEINRNFIVKVDVASSVNSLLDSASQIRINEINATKTRPLFFCDVVHASVVTPRTEDEHSRLCHFLRNKAEDSLLDFLKENVLSLTIFCIPERFVTLNELLFGPGSSSSSSSCPSVVYLSDLKKKLQAIFPILVAHLKRMNLCFGVKRVNFSGLIILANISERGMISLKFIVKSAQTFLSGVHDSAVNDEASVSLFLMEVLEKFKSAGIEYDEAISGEIEDLQAFCTRLQGKDVWEIVTLTKDPYFFDPTSLSKGIQRNAPENHYHEQHHHQNHKQPYYQKVAEQRYETNGNRQFPFKKTAWRGKSSKRGFDNQRFNPHHHQQQQQRNNYQRHDENQHYQKVNNG